MNTYTVCVYDGYVLMMCSMRQKKTLFKRSRRGRVFCVKGPFNLNGHNSRTTAGVDLHRTHDRSTHTVVSN